MSYHKEILKVLLLAVGFLKELPFTVNLRKKVHHFRIFGKRRIHMICLANSYQCRNGRTKNTEREME